MKFFRDVLLCICVFLVSVQFAVAEPLKPGDYEAFKDHIVVVRNGDVFGTGIVVDVDAEAESITILSAYHILRMDLITLAGQSVYVASVIIKDEDGYGFQGDVIAKDESLDLVLIRISGVLQEETVLKPIQSVRVSKLFIGEDVFIIGNKLGYSWSFSFGKIMETERYFPGRPDKPRIQIDTLTNVGDSGGALFDGSGSLIGVMLEKDPRSPMGFVVPITEVCKLKMEDRMKWIFHCPSGIPENPHTEDDNVILKQ